MIGLVDYGAGNLRSVEFALEALRVPHRRVAEPEALEAVDRVILPGVGAAASAMAELERRGLASVLRRWDGPLLGICLGLQILVERSSEGDEDVECLGLLPGRVRPIRADAPLPHIGWNRTELGGGPLFSELGARAWFYYLHSMRVVCDEELVSARATYGERFPAAIRAGPVAGVQFHPEKSGEAGLGLLASFCRSRWRDGMAAREAR